MRSVARSTEAGCTVDDPPAQLGDLGLGAEHRLGGDRAETDHQLRRDELELGGQPRRAGHDLGAPRSLMDAAFAALGEPEVSDRVGEIQRLAVHADLGECPVQQVPGGADEGVTVEVLVIARLLADHDGVGRRRALAEHGLGRGAIEVAAVAPGGCLADPGQVLGVRNVFRRTGIAGSGGHRDPPTGAGTDSGTRVTEAPARSARWAKVIASRTAAPPGSLLK